MLVEIAVTNLGVIDHLSLTVPQGMIALTGETGAGKTLLVDAINLLVGGRADPALVRSGESEAVVDGRFLLGDEELIISRVIPADGRSRAYVNGRPSTAGALAELGSALVDLHGQHAHQSLLGVDSQRQALDTFGRIDLSALDHARAALAEVDASLAALGGDEQARARELDLVRYQVNELVEADLQDPEEDENLEGREDLLANAAAHREAAGTALESLVGEGGARDVLASALAPLENADIFADVAARLRTTLAEVDDLADTVRSLNDVVEEDPEELAHIMARRRMLRELCRKYGENVGLVIAERDSLQQRLKELEDHDRLAAELDERRAKVLQGFAVAKKDVLLARENAAPNLAAAIQSHLPELAMPKAKVGIDVAGDDGSEVSFQLAANPGSALQPLAKVASGGELARTMLALRSVLSEAPPVLIFDEVDAGIGGQAGFAVGRSLANLGDRHQVLVVTHLPQVAAFADAHLAVVKRQGEDDTVSEVQLLDDQGRLTEVARMLSGQPDSATARQHASELIAEAAAQRPAR